MTKSVFKYTLAQFPTDRPSRLNTHVELPDWFKVLHLGVQKTLVKAEAPKLGLVWSEDVQLWAMVDPKAPTRPRRVVILCTGEPTDDPDLEGLVHVGTVLLRGDQLVLHLFVEAPSSSSPSCTSRPDSGSGSRRRPGPIRSRRPAGGSPC